MKVLITGSSGQIGTNLALSLLARGNQVLGVDKRPNAWSQAFTTEILDLSLSAAAAGTRTLITLAQDFQPDVIVHLAAWAKVHQLVREPEKAFENVAMIYWALEAARVLGKDKRQKTKDQTRGPAVVFGSSREVYGDIHRHVTDESMTDFVIAESPYSASKIAGEAFVSSYARCYGIPTLVFRFSNVYGRFDNDLDRMERVIPLFVRKIWRGEPITVFGRDKMLDFTYVDDCVAGVAAGIDALATGKVTTETINLAYGQGQTLYDLVTLIELATGKTANATYAPSQTGEVTRYVADISKAKALLGYAPQMPLAKGIFQYVNWCKQSGFLT
jgi:UDP-glucose 4-epimerase